MQRTHFIKLVILFSVLAVISILIVQMSRQSALSNSLILEWMVLIVVWSTLAGIVYGCYKLFLKPKPLLLKHNGDYLNLSQRELDVLELMNEGLTNREIGDRLFVAEVTIKKNASSIFQKLNAKRRTDALRRAREMELIK